LLRNFFSMAQPPPGQEGNSPPTIRLIGLHQSDILFASFANDYGTPAVLIYAQKSDPSRHSGNIIPGKQPAASWRNSLQIARCRLQRSVDVGVNPLP
jgi:hypothetical protein